MAECEWCFDAEGNALESINICAGCLQKHQIPAYMIEWGEE